MFIKGYKMTEEHKKNIGLANKISVKRYYDNGGKNWNTGKKWSEEVKQKMRENHWSKRPDYISHKHSEETIQKIKIALSSPEAKEKCRIAATRKHTPEEIEKLKISITGRIRPPFSEEWKNKIIQKSPFQKGEKHLFWKGGISPLYAQIRGLSENRQWMKKVFIRDNYTCQDCSIKSGCGHRVYLSAHHIKSFAKILNEFLFHYSQFSPIEDKETLARLAMTYEPFWDISNGQTLCKDCHKLTPNYVGRNKEIL